MSDIAGWAGIPVTRRGVTFHIEVPDLQKTLAAIEERGGKTVMPPSDVPGGPRMAQFLDPEGNRIGLVQAGPMPQPA